MDRLANFPLNEPRKIRQLRQKYEASPGSAEIQTELGIALASGGCTYEATALLRPTRSVWKSSPKADVATSALAAQTWWNKNWREFAHRKHASDRAGALALLGDKAVDYWDLPPLLMHLGDFASADGKLDLAEHLYRRVQWLAQLGLPKMNMVAFRVRFTSIPDRSLVAAREGQGRPCRSRGPVPQSRKCNGLRNAEGPCTRGQQAR